MITYDGPGVEDRRAKVLLPLFMYVFFRSTTCYMELVKAKMKQRLSLNTPREPCKIYFQETMPTHTNPKLFTIHS